MPKVSIEEALQLARQHFMGGRLAEAEIVCRAIVQVSQQESAVYSLLGLIAYHRLDLPGATAFLQQALALDPQDAVPHNTLGAVFAAQGRLEEAVAAARRALALQPTFFEAENNLGHALEALGRRQEAEAAYRRGLAINPRQAGTLNMLGALLHDRGQFPEAAETYRQAISLSPNFPEASTNLAVTLQAQGRLDEAEAAYRQAIALRPSFAEAEANLGSLLHAMGRPEEAEAACRRAAALQPNNANAYINMGAAFHSQGRVEEARAAYWHAVSIRPTFAFAHSSALFSEQYMPDVTPERLATVHAEWDRRQGQPLRATWRPHSNVRDPERPLRVGFVSADLSRHPVGLFIVRPLEALDRRRCQVVCYSDRVVKDDVTQRLANVSQAWRDVRGLSDEALAEQVRADAIDILFDLAGHGVGGRLLAFARKPAPIQITWLGYEGTTGLSAMDYILADRYQIPAGMEQHYREKVLRMPDGYVCFEPFSPSPPVGPLPAAQQGYVTFASFNNLAKITPQVIAVWAEIMRRLPGSRIALRYKGLETKSGQDRYAELFAAQGIERQRLDLTGWSSHFDALVKYNQVDIGLDTFPFSGSLTTCDALWMGVPVLTWPGCTFAGRHTLSHLSNSGLTDLVASDRADYVERTVALANDLSRLAALRAGLRAQVAASPLCDARRFAAHFMDAMRGVWHTWLKLT